MPENSTPRGSVQVRWVFVRSRENMCHMFFEHATHSSTLTTMPKKQNCFSLFFRLVVSVGSFLFTAPNSLPSRSPHAGSHAQKPDHDSPFFYTSPCHFVEAVLPEDKNMHHTSNLQSQNPKPTHIVDPQMSFEYQ